MRVRSEHLLVIAVPTMLVLLRIPFMLGRDGPYGYDPYIHLYFVKSWLGASGWPLFVGDADIIEHDYNAWPGVHAFGASVSSVGGVDPLEVLVWTPLILLFLLNLAVILIVLRRAGPRLAAVTGVLFGLADYVFLQTQWYTPELFGLLLVSTLLLNELTVRRSAISLLVLTTLLVTHHLSFLMGVLFWLVMTKSRPDRTQLMMTVVIIVEVLLFWEVALRNTGSFPDIQNRVGGVPPSVVVTAVVVGLVGLKWVASRLRARYLGGHDGEGSILELVAARFERRGYVATLVGLAVLTAVTIAVYASSVARFDGIGVQPTKLLILAGGLMFLAYVPLQRDSLRVLAAFGLLVALFVLNPLLFDFLPLEIRFLEFMYIPGFVLLALGAHHLAARSPRKAGTMLMALVLTAPVLLADDALRYASDGSQRFVFSQEDLDFAEGVRELTEEGAVVVTPFGMAGVVRGMAERRTRTFPVREALDGEGYVDAVPYLDELAVERPVFLVHSSDRLLYMETEDDEVTGEDIERLGASLALIADRLELLLDEGPHHLYRFH